MDEYVALRSSALALTLVAEEVSELSSSTEPQLVTMRIVAHHLADVLTRRSGFSAVNSPGI
jgi:hypothetical protein